MQTILVKNFLKSVRRILFTIQPLAQFSLQVEMSLSPRCHPCLTILRVQPPKAPIGHLRPSPTPTGGLVLATKLSTCQTSQHFSEFRLSIVPFQFCLLALVKGHPPTGQTLFLPENSDFLIITIHFTKSFKKFSKEARIGFAQDLKLA